jgi:hypothetical protein
LYFSASQNPLLSRKQQKSKKEKVSMKRFFAVFSLVVLVLAGTKTYAASATANATATVITPIAISSTADLRFGEFAAGSGGTVVISTAGARSKTGGVVLSTVAPGGAASFSVTGDADATYAITLPGTATITRVSGTETMSVGTFTSDPTETGTLSAGGTQTVAVGGTLTVGASQVVGSYTGTFSVSVEYN